MLPHSRALFMRWPAWNMHGPNARPSASAPARRHRAGGWSGHRPPSHLMLGHPAGEGPVAVEQPFRSESERGRRWLSELAKHPRQLFEAGVLFNWLRRFTAVEGGSPCTPTGPPLCLRCDGSRWDWAHGVGVLVIVECLAEFTQEVVRLSLIGRDPGAWAVPPVEVGRQCRSPAVTSEVMHAVRHRDSVVA
jgi:hypothetical protein